MGDWVDRHFGLSLFLMIVGVIVFFVVIISIGSAQTDAAIAACNRRGMIYAHVPDQRVPNGDNFNHYGKGDYCISVQPEDMQ